MDSNTGGQSSSDKSRDTAVQIAREKVVAAFSGADPKETNKIISISGEDWQHYHSAWQNYYQKYYSDYYAKAAKAYVENERKKIQPASTADESNDRPDDDPITKRLRAAVRAKAKATKGKNKFKRKAIPIIAGISVTAIILFLQFNRIIFAPIIAYVSPGNAPASSIEAVNPAVTATVSADPKLIIPKINVDVPVAFGIPLSQVNSAMRTGVAHYRIAGASAFPGQLGNVVISGHSAGDVYNNDPYKFIFSGLERLNTGDMIYVNYNSKRYSYSIIKKSVVLPSEVAAVTEKFDKPMLILVTCTPLGVSTHRLLVFAEQVSPSPANAISAEPVTDSTENIDLPSNSPSFFTRVWNWITGQE